jgi:cytochrome P450
MQLLQCRLQGAGIASEIPIARMLGPYVPLQIFQDLFNSDSVLHKYASVAVASSRLGSQRKNIFANILQQAEKEEILDDEDMTIEAHGLIIAGSDTTAITLTYLIWAVSSRPTLMEQLQEEVSALPTGFVDAELEKLPLLNAVIEETLRLYGAVPGSLPRMVPPSGTTLGGYYCPAGTTVTTQSYSTHRQSNAFPNPFEYIFLN